MMRARPFLAGLAGLALAGAALLGCTSTHYDWGRYEDSVFEVTRQPDSFDLAAEIDTLEAQLQQSADRQRLPPPGLHAHLGYLHSVAGNLDAARSHFEDEKALFPESARFMDQLIARLGPRP